jgi:hypothetical protein
MARYHRGTVPATTRRLSESLGFWARTRLLRLNRLGAAPARTRTSKTHTHTFGWPTQWVGIPDLEEATAPSDELAAGRGVKLWIRASQWFVSAKTLPAVALYGMFSFCSSSAIADPLPPRDGCRAASKIEYDSAKSQFLLINRHGVYLRTGHFWDRHYWHCPP